MFTLDDQESRVKPDKPVYIIGIGTTELRRRQDRDDVDMAVAACRAALDDAGVEAHHVTGLNIQSHHAPGPDVGAAVRALGLKQITWAPDGGIGVPGLTAACDAVLSGRTTAALVCKVMNTATALNVPSIDPDTRGVAGRDQYELPYGIGYTVQRAALVQRRWTASRGVTPEQLGTMCVVQREHALRNDNAIFRTPLTVADYLDSRVICDPIRLFDCDYPVNGAYAYLVTADRALGRPDWAVTVRGWTGGEADDMPHIRIEHDPGVRPDVAALFDDLGITARDLSALMLYDGFSFLAAQWFERLGVVRPGDVGEYLGDPANIRFDGLTPLNTHGGQLSEGRMHAAGHLLEAVRQIRGDAEGRQVRDCVRVAVTTAFPSTGAVAILEKAS
jgi:acetyl-CoA acetyltransferase